MNVLHFFTAMLVIYAGVQGSEQDVFHMLYWGGAVFFIALLIYQHFLVKPNDLTRVNLAFFTTNGIASLIFGILVIVAMYL